MNRAMHKAVTLATHLRRLDAQHRLQLRALVLEVSPEEWAQLAEDDSWRLGLTSGQLSIRFRAQEICVLGILKIRPIYQPREVVDAEFSPVLLQLPNFTEDTKVS